MVVNVNIIPKRSDTSTHRLRVRFGRYALNAYLTRPSAPFTIFKDVATATPAYRRTRAPKGSPVKQSMSFFVHPGWTDLCQRKFENTYYANRSNVLAFVFFPFGPSTRRYPAYDFGRFLRKRLGGFLRVHPTVDGKCT